MAGGEPCEQAGLDWRLLELLGWILTVGEGRWTVVVTPTESRYLCSQESGIFIFLSAGPPECSCSRRQAQ